MRFSTVLATGFLFIQIAGCASAKVVSFDNTDRTVNVQVKNGATASDAEAVAIQHCRGRVKMLKMDRVVTGTRSSGSVRKYASTAYGDSRTTNVTIPQYTFKCEDRN